jgi:predicted nucleic acid-binding protein
MIVIDASAMVELLFGHSPRAAAVAARIDGDRESLHAPEMIDLEILSVLRSLERRGVDGRLIAGAVSDLPAVPLRRYPHLAFSSRIWELRSNLTPYDAAYVALAELLDAPLLTCDARLAGAPGHRARVELVG